MCKFVVKKKQSSKGCAVKIADKFSTKNSSPTGRIDKESVQTKLF